MNRNKSAPIEVQNVSMRYQSSEGTVVALDSINHKIAPGRFVVLVGPSGCGKSSLLMMMAGLRTATEGTITCDGKAINEPNPDLVGVVFQEANLYPWLTSQKNVEFPLMLKKVPPEERERRALEALQLVGLEKFAQRYPHELSGGMRQRVSIARGLVQQPEVLLMDEPFAALDEQTRLSMGDELLRIWDRTKQTIVFVTHSLTEAVYLADEIVVMSARPGRIIDVVEVDLPRPRTLEMMSTEAFGQLRERVWRQIRH
jgi:NitT/TauT family transport system ATP-binding protein